MKSEIAFLQAWADSHHRVAKVAVWFAERGSVVVIPPWKVRPDVGQREAYADDGDLVVDGGRIEVKGRRSPQFESLESFPFPTLIVCERYTWDHAEPHPVAFLVVNPAESGFLAVKTGRTHRHWRVESIYDTTLSETREFYVCPIGRVTYHALGPP